ncbi:hypothetical protein AAMO2058_001368100 [Amorphochlora amoebiformis]
MDMSENTENIHTCSSLPKLLASVPVYKLSGTTSFTIWYNKLLSCTRVCPTVYYLLKGDLVKDLSSAFRCISSKEEMLRKLGHYYDLSYCFTELTKALSEQSNGGGFHDTEFLARYRKLHPETTIPPLENPKVGVKTRSQEKEVKGADGKLSPLDTEQAENVLRSITEQDIFLFRYRYRVFYALGDRICRQYRQAETDLFELLQHKLGPSLEFLSEESDSKGSIVITRLKTALKGDYFEQTKRFVNLRQQHGQGIAAYSKQVARAWEGMIAALEYELDIPKDCKRCAKNKKAMLSFRKYVTSSGLLPVYQRELASSAYRGKFADSTWEESLPELILFERSQKLGPYSRGNRGSKNNNRNRHASNSGANRRVHDRTKSESTTFSAHTGDNPGHMNRGRGPRRYCKICREEGHHPSRCIAASQNGGLGYHTVKVLALIRANNSQLPSSNDRTQ